VNNWLQSLRSKLKHYIEASPAAVAAAAADAKTEAANARAESKRMKAAMEEAEREARRGAVQVECSLPIARKRLVSTLEAIK
jgi:hypothetical protein